MFENIWIVIAIILVVVIFGTLALIATFYRKVPQGKALVRTGPNGVKVSTGGILVIPVVHTLETMDISVKQMLIEREGKDGLICKDNMRADIKVAFFVRVNPEKESIARVAQTIGCERASDPELLRTLFEALFSEAVKTVGINFNFVDLYNSRSRLKQLVMEEIGDDLNGYALQDIAIDYLEQTPVEFLDADNILDAEGIKKIRDLTAKQITLANKIQREKEKELKKQDVEAREAILELEKQQEEKEAVQKREIANIRSREEAQIKQVEEEERAKSEKARLTREREVEIEEQNKQRDIIAAKKNKERTEAVETEKVERDRQLEETERQRIVELAQIEKEKALEEERKNIQDVIRDRVAVEREVVEEKERMKDTESIAGAEREKTVAILNAEKRAQEKFVEQVKLAEAGKDAAELEAQKRIIEANAAREAADKEAEAKKIMADATAEEHAALGLAEARVAEAKAQAREKEGEAEANALEFKNVAEAKGIELKGEAQAEASRKQGLVDAQVEIEKGMAEAKVLEAKANAEEKMGLSEAKIIEEKGLADAKGVEAKAKAMKQLDGVGKEHEEFKLRLEKDTQIELAAIDIQKQIAAAQAQVLAEALKSANIDIMGGEQEFFDRLSQAVTTGKFVDKLFSESDTMKDLKKALLGNGTGTGNGSFTKSLGSLINQFNISSEDVKNLSISALVMKMMQESKDEGQRNLLSTLLNIARSLGVSDKTAEAIGLAQS
ncbi:MAG: flotillin family protein [Bacteroidia bacterium]|nr:flotillin family protein [Bacteroidia bacterium]